MKKITNYKQLKSMLNETVDSIGVGNNIIREVAFSNMSLDLNELINDTNTTQLLEFNNCEFNNVELLNCNHSIILAMFNVNLNSSSINDVKVNDVVFLNVNSINTIWSNNTVNYFNIRHSKLDTDIESNNLINSLNVYNSILLGGN